MKQLLISCSLLWSLAAAAQTIPTTVKFNKATTPALSLRVPYSESVAEGAIIQKLKETGYSPETSGALLWKKNTVDGYYAFKNVSLQGNNGRLADLYFKVDQTSRKDRGQSTIYLVMGQGPERFISAETDRDLYDAGASFLNGLQEYSAGYKLDLDITAHEEALQNAEKKLQKMRDDQQDLEEKLRNNRQQQENQQKLIESERSKLEDLKNKKQGKD